MTQQFWDSSYITDQRNNISYTNNYSIVNILKFKQSIDIILGSCWGFVSSLRAASFYKLFKKYTDGG